MSLKNLSILIYWKNVQIIVNNNYIHIENIEFIPPTNKFSLNCQLLILSPVTQVHLLFNSCVTVPYRLLNTVIAY